MLLLMVFLFNTFLYTVIYQNIDHYVNINLGQKLHSQLFINNFAAKLNAIVECSEVKKGPKDSNWKGIPNKWKTRIIKQK